MKKLFLGALLACSMCAATSSNAQVRVNVNIGAPVANQPWYGTDNDYYYLPEQGVYYNTRRNVYVYQENNNWVYNRQLPARYNGYTWQRSHYVRVHERTPFGHHETYSGRYPNNYRGDHNGRWNNGNNNGNNHHDDHGRHR